MKYTAKELNTITTALSLMMHDRAAIDNDKSRESIEKLITKVKNDKQHACYDRATTFEEWLERVNILFLEARGYPWEQLFEDKDFTLKALEELFDKEMSVAAGINWLTYSLPEKIEIGKATFYKFGQAPTAKSDGFTKFAVEIKGTMKSLVEIFDFDEHVALIQGPMVGNTNIFSYYVYKRD